MIQKSAKINSFCVLEKVKQKKETAGKVKTESVMLFGAPLKHPYF
jgi:hypothetical protein